MVLNPLKLQLAETGVFGIMAKHQPRNIGYVAATFFVTVITFTVRVVAQQDGGIGDGGGEFSEGFAVAGIILFSFAVLTGMLMFLSIRPPFIKLFKKMKLKMKTLKIIHHPLTIISVIVWGLHGLPMIAGRAEEVSPSGLVIGWATIVLLSTGFLFPLMKNFKQRKALRYIHLTLMIIVVIAIGLHLASGEL